MNEKEWNMRLKNTYEKYNVIEIHKKVSQIEWKPCKLSLKPSENKEFKRNECRKVGEMNEKEWKMTLKNTYETYNAFKKPKKWTIQKKIEQNAIKTIQK